MRAFLRPPEGARMSAKRHESPIKTPKQLVTVLVLAFVVPIVVIVLLAQLATSGRNYDEDAKSPEAVAKRIKPVAEVNMGTAGPGGKNLQNGGEKYKWGWAPCDPPRGAKTPQIGGPGDRGARSQGSQEEVLRGGVE